jgi:hypothetical protein
MTHVFFGGEGQGLSCYRAAAPIEPTWADAQENCMFYVIE